jgi:hypothetical protein
MTKKIKVIGTALYDSEIKEFLEYYTHGNNVIKTEDQFCQSTLQNAFGESNFCVIFIEPLVENTIGHWVCAFYRHLKNGKPAVEYFNSLGEPPSEKLITAFDRWNIDYSTNHVQLQGKYSNTCGKWIISRILSQDISLKEFVAIFLENSVFKNPDEIVDKLYRLRRITDI